MEHNDFKRKSDAGGDLVTKKVREDEAERPRLRFCDMFFFDEGFVCKRDDAEVKRKQQQRECSVNKMFNDGENSISEVINSDYDPNEDEIMSDEETDGSDFADDEPSGTSGGAIVQGDSFLKEGSEDLNTTSEGLFSKRGNKESKNILVSNDSGEFTLPGDSRLDETEIAADPMCPFRETLHSDDACMGWLQAHGLIPNHSKCPSCGHIMPLEKLEKRVRGPASPEYVWRCKFNRKVIVSGKLHPIVRCSVMNGTVFNRSRLSARQAMIVIYYFARNLTNSPAFHRDTAIAHFSTPTSITACLSMCRQLCLMWLLDNCDKNRTLGGPGRPVEVLRCDVANSPTFTLCFVEHNDTNPKRDMRFIVDSCMGRDYESVKSMVLKYVNDRVFVVTDLFKSFSPFNNIWHFKVDQKNRRLEPLSKRRRLINASVLWKAKRDSGGLKKGLVRMFLPTRLSEFFYRREVEKMAQDPFWHFIHVIKTYYSFE